MPDLLARLADGTATWLLTYLVHSTVLILATWTLTRVTTLQPATRDFLWKMALVAGVCTASMASLWRQSPVTIDYAAQSERLHDATVERVAWVGDPSSPPIQIRARLVDPSPECRALLRRGLREGPGVMSRVDDVCGAGGTFAWWHGALLVWLLGGAFGSLVLIRRRESVVFLTRALTEAAPRSQMILEELRADEGTHTVRVKGSHLVNAACVLPGDTIAISARCESELSDEELRAVLAHELGHIVRRDPLWSTALRLLSTILWIQPLNRLGLAKVDEASEHLCDDWAVSRTGGAIGLATSISRVAGWALPMPRQPALMSVVGRRGRGLSERVRRILFEGPRHREPGWFRHAAAVAMLVPLYWLPVVQAPDTLHASIIVEEGGTLLSPEQLAWVHRLDGADIERIEIRRSVASPAGEAAGGTVVERRVVLARLPQD